MSWKSVCDVIKSIFHTSQCEQWCRFSSCQLKSLTDPQGPPPAPHLAKIWDTRRTHCAINYFVKVFVKLCFFSKRCTSHCGLKLLSACELSTSSLEGHKRCWLLSFNLNPDSIILCYQWIMLSCSNYKNTPSLHHSCCIKKPFFSLTTSSFLAIFGYLWFDSNSRPLSPTRHSSHGHFPPHLFIFSTSTSPLGACWLNSTHCS